ncbi:MAG: hypothetical protein M1133_08240 [Armatimonadetes bacterium]|nr:hypothetical protein [Armatimonadota bacterium]
MDQFELRRQIDELKEKLNKSMRKAEGLKNKSKVLESQYQDSREREKNTNDLVMELLERQRELNVMLNRANIMLNRVHETMALTSVEFNEMAKALPEPKKAEWSDRVSRINELFKKTGAHDAEVLGLESSNPSLDTDELKRESEEAFGKHESIWDRKEKREPPKVEAELVEEMPPHAATEPESAFGQPEITIHVSSDEAQEFPDDELPGAPSKKPWWFRISSGNKTGAA